MVKSDETRHRKQTVGPADGKQEPCSNNPEATPAISLKSSDLTSRKRTYVAYLLWLIGGCFGLHQLYLRRDRHAFLIWSTLGGYLGFGLIRDLWRIPEYVRDANEDDAYIEKLEATMRKKAKPPFNFFRQTGAVVAGNVWGWLFQVAIPKEKVYGIDLQVLELFIPVVIALGVHTVGNVGRIQGGFKWPFIGACSYPLLKMVEYDSLSMAAIASTTLFEWKSAQWRKTPRKTQSLKRRAILLAIFVLIYTSTMMSYLYFNAEVTDSTGETTKFRDAVANFLSSPLWIDFKNTCKILLDSLWNNGWSETWNQLKDNLDPFGEQQALKVLELDSGASQEEITARWRKLSREWHPDRFNMDEEKKKLAQEKFMQYNAAYETLSQMKARRNRKNKSFQNY